ncbi:hypothetical protein [Flavobacterium terrisoli]|uniref:hypothetical protein n=1 Tax=Flavobacterium terrisoli TaxID=3242195 RepID=UPI002542C117|nr:hypothetical protein [Flavobacterium buctense]
MKFFYLCILFCSLFISCSDSSDTNHQNTTAHRFAVVNIDTIPINKDNPYDAAGQIHHELLTAYYNGESLPLTLTGIISSTQTIANETTSFMNLTKGVPYMFNYSDRVAYIVSQPDGFQDEIINGTLETNEAKNSLKSFVTSLLSLCELEEDYSILHNYIINYEESILKKESLTLKDKQVILTTTSIARHSVYARKKKPKKDKDPEWQYMVGNIFAAIDGADDSMADAVMKGLITGIVENK